MGRRPVGPERLPPSERARNPKPLLGPKVWEVAPAGIPAEDWAQLKPAERYRLFQVLNVQAPGPDGGALLAGLYARDSAVVMRAREAARILSRALKRLQVVTWCDVKVKNQFNQLRFAVEKVRGSRLQSKEVARRAGMPHARLVDILYLRKMPNLYESVRLARVWGTTAEHLAWALAAGFSRRMLDEGVVHATRKRLRNSAQTALQAARYLPAPQPWGGMDNMPDLLTLALEDSEQRYTRPSRWLPGKPRVKRAPKATPEEPVSPGPDVLPAGKA